MSNEIEYIEPTQEHVGQMVEVADLPCDKWYRHELLAVLPDRVPYKFTTYFEGYHSKVRNWTCARIPRPLTYAERQAKCGLKVGDRVRILTLPESGQDGWKAGACGNMRHLVGCVYEITHDCKEFGFTVGGWNLPYFVLEKVKDRKATNKDFGKTIYVDGNPADEFKMEMAYQVNGEPYRAVVRSGDKRFVYELSNLRVKE